MVELRRRRNRTANQLNTGLLTHVWKSSTPRLAFTLRELAALPTQFQRGPQRRYLVEWRGKWQEESVWLCPPLFERP